MFPEAIKIIPTKIIELEEDKKRLIGKIHKKINIIKENFTDWYSITILTAYIRAYEGEHLLKIDRQINRLKRLASRPTKIIAGTSITEDRISQALEVPILNIATQYTKFKKSGRNFVGLCPIHQEKNPSFYVYTKTNSFYCFGCNQGGNTINLIRKLRGYSFKDAINYLLGRF
jgi:hypothetical protein